VDRRVIDRDWPNDCDEIEAARGPESVGGELPALNEEFYAGDPADYFLRRLLGLLILKGKPEELRKMMAESVDAGGVRLELVRQADPGAQSEKDDADGRDRFITADSWVLLHRASETLLRLYLAHAGDGPCPVLEIART
jgi:hypothetical protein